MTNGFELLGFHSGDRGKLEARGLCHDTMEEIFRGPRCDRREVEILAGAPEDVRIFLQGEYRAADFSFRAMRLKEIRVPDPWTGQIVATQSGFTTPAQGELPYEMLPFYYRLVDPAGREFWLVSYYPYGRITHVVLPREKVIVYGLPNNYAADAIGHQLSQYAADFRSADNSRPRRGARVVGVVDFLNNYGHQLINHLSGLQRLVEEVDLSCLDEVWLSGIEFLAPAERLFPEIAAKVRRFDNPWQMHDILIRGGYLPLRIGSSIFRRSIGERIRQSCAGRGAARSPLVSAQSKKPVIAITVRAEGRRCLNLVQVVEAAIAALMKTHPDLGVVLDGFVIPDSRVGPGASPPPGCPADYYRSSVQADMELANRLRAVLPSELVIGNLVGMSMSQSMRALTDIDVYLSHIGTPQHKLGFLTRAMGVVHGPRTQLATPHAGHYSVDSGVAPLFLEPTAVEDVPSQTWRGHSFDDYNITDLDDVIRKLKRVLDTGA